MPTITINDLEIPYAIRLSARAKHPRIQFSEQGLLVVQPRGVSERILYKMLNKNRNWILRHYKNFQQKKQRNINSQWPLELKADELLPFQQQRYPLKFHDSNSKQIIIEHNTDCITIHKPINLDQQHPLITRSLHEWYLQQAYSAVAKAIEHYTPILGLEPNGFSVKYQKNQWGSCGIRNKIYINWLLILAPSWVLEYVVVHELCHLRYRSHGVRFWGLVEKLFPDYKAAVRWLREHSLVLPEFF